MPHNTARDDVEYWLKNTYPGGSWILPHWDAGPFWLLPIPDPGAATGGTRRLLAASSRVAKRMPIHDGDSYSRADIYAVPNFTRDYLIATGAAAPELATFFPLLPGAGDLVAVLGELLGVTSPDAPHSTAVRDVLVALREAHPDEVLTAFAALDPEFLHGEHPPAPGVGSQPLLAYLTAIAGMVASRRK